MNPAVSITRRDFLRVAATAGGGFVLALHLPWQDDPSATALAASAPFEPNAWLCIDPDGAVTITVARSELGQGVRTSLAMIVAEELDADWSTVRVAPAVADPKYGNMTTAGSSSVRGSWERLRRAGATARAMLVEAAARSWSVPATECRTENSAVLHEPSGRRLSYGELAAAAAQIPVPEDAPLRDPKTFRLVGRSLPRLDAPSKIDGSARFGVDVREPGTLVAMVERCPVFGGKLQSFDGRRALAVPGVRHVVEVPSGVAVVGDDTWAVQRGRAALTVTWDEGPNAGLDSAAIRRMLEEKSREPGHVARQEGDAAAALAAAARRVEAVYELPFLSHAPLEPQNCIAAWKDGGLEIVAPTQAPQLVQRFVAPEFGLAPEQVRVHTTLAGGAFGRRLLWDYAAEAAHVAKAVGARIQVLWTREDDVQHDYYRPTSLHRLAAGIDAGGQVIAWSHRLVGPSIMGQLWPEAEDPDGPDAVDGAAQIAYRIPNVLVDYVMANTPVPVGWWRSVYHSQNAFANECFLDEIAVALGADACELRRRLLPEGSRLRRTLDLAAEKSGWSAPPPRGRFRGIACHESFHSTAAEVVEASVDDLGRVRVHRVVCAADAGIVVHPDGLAAQVEGAIALGLGAALHGEITIARGRVHQSNFDDYGILAFDAMPEIEVHTVPSGEAPTGIGEPPLPPLAPALCNAVFAATGRRVRRLPIRAEELRRT
jgi:isoquinoline 1-oxidoreductase beta subunit